MKKENILFAVCGVLLGFIGGFFFANHYNRGAITAESSAGQTTAQQVPAPFSNTTSQASAPNIQPQENLSVPMPFVQQTIDKAKAEPKNVEAQVAAGDLFYRVQRFQDAIPYYQKAVEIGGENSDILTKLGNSFFDIKDYTQAQKFYSQVLNKKPDDVNVRTDYGLSFFLQSPPDAQRAVEEYRKSLTVNPNHELTLQNLAVAQDYLADTSAMRETLTTLEKVNAANPIISKLRAKNAIQ